MTTSNVYRPEENDDFTEATLKERKYHESKGHSIWLGVTLDQKILFLSCLALARYGPSVQLTYFIALILFLMADNVCNTYCKYQKNNRKEGWIFGRDGLSDRLIAWSSFLLYTIQVAMQLLILCDLYVDMMRSLPKQDNSISQEDCTVYSRKWFKTVIIIPVWFYLALQMSGSENQLQKERKATTMMITWTLRIELLGLFILTPGTLLRSNESHMLFQLYFETSVSEILHSLMEVIIILHPYWIVIPRKGKLRDIHSVQRGCLNQKQETLKLLTVLIFMYVGVVQPFYISNISVKEAGLECRPFWFLVLSSAFFRACLFTSRAVLIISGIYMSVYFASCTLETMALNGYIFKVFAICNPLNKSPVIALIFTLFLAGLMASLLPLQEVIMIQAFNILITRSILALTALHMGSSEKIVHYDGLKIMKRSQKQMSSFMKRTVSLLYLISLTSLFFTVLVRDAINDFLYLAPLFVLIFAAILFEPFCFGLTKHNSMKKWKIMATLEHLVSTLSFAVNAGLAVIIKRSGGLYCVLLYVLGLLLFITHALTGRFHEFRRRTKEVLINVKNGDVHLMKNKNYCN